MKQEYLVRVLGRSLLIAALVFGLPYPAPHADAAGIYTYEAKGVDSCAAPTTAQMQAWWNGTPFYQWYIYIGGVNRACSQPNLTSGWITTVRDMGWGLMLIWVGPQAPCTLSRNFNRFSSNPTTAYNQGRAEGTAAYNKAIDMGFGATQPIVYDLEYFDTNDPQLAACKTAAKSFIRGWVESLHVIIGEKAGVYGSVCSSYLDSYASNTPAPDFIWGAWWNLNPSTSNMTCVNAANWASHQRHKQYQGPHNETWNGVMINIDDNCAYGPVWANQARLLGSCA